MYARTPARICGYEVRARARAAKEMAADLVADIGIDRVSWIVDRGSSVDSNPRIFPLFGWSKSASDYELRIAYRGSSIGRSEHNDSQSGSATIVVPTG